MKVWNRNAKSGRAGCPKTIRTGDLSAVVQTTGRSEYPTASVSQMIPRSRLQLNRSVRPQEPLQELTTNDDAMLTFERAPKSRTPKFLSS
jgi:hypothetical protein